MNKEEAIEKLNALAWVQGGPDREEMIEAISMAIESLSAEDEQGVGRYENAMQKLRDMPRYLNGVKEKQIIKISTNYTTEKPNGVVDSKNDVVVEPTDLISRADAIGAVRKLIEEPSKYYTQYNNGIEDSVKALSALPSAEQVTGKLKNPCDSLLKDDSEDSKEQKSKLDLISRGDLISDLEEWKKNPNNDDSAVDLVNHFIGIIKAAPSADRPSGEWVEKEVMVDEDTNITEWQSAKCSVCGKYHTTPYMYYFDSFNYCPNCGAKMGGNK